VKREGQLEAPTFSLDPSRVREPGAALFLLAHQDDEIAFAPLMALLGAQGRRLCVVYLTDGAAGRATPAQRASETTRALAALGIPAADIRFLGSDLSIPDEGLVRHLGSAHDALESECQAICHSGDLFSLAWEGGHPDHDATHVLALALAKRHGWDDRTWQVPFYRAAECGPPFFTLFAPLPSNGPVWHLPAARHDALLRARMIRFFPSQWRSLAGLAPAVLWHALLGTPVTLQRVPVDRPLARPTAGPLLYEQRTGITFVEFAEHANRFLEERAAMPTSRSQPGSRPVEASRDEEESS
jgi:LmbE family N-acetylglucosaminyl deacetylase